LIENPKSMSKLSNQYQYIYIVFCDNSNNIKDGEENPIAAALTYKIIKNCANQNAYMVN
ncbi:21037_t:CDS:1, partial [Rhizophagus irregularis]